MLSLHRFSLGSSGSNVRALDLVLFAIGENGVEVRDVLASSSVDLNCDPKLETNFASVSSAEDTCLKLFLIIPKKPELIGLSCVFSN